MGSSAMGKMTYEGNQQMLTPEQQAYLSSIFGGGNAQAAGQAYSQFLQPYDPTKYQDVFQKAYVDPAMMAFNRNIVPGIQQSAVDLNAGSSSALNQALAQASADLGTQVGAQYGNFFNQQQANTLSALGQLGNLSTQRTFEIILS